VTELTTAPYERADREALFDLYARVWGTRPEQQDFEWWYEGSPSGEALRTLAKDGEEIAGVASMSFARVRIDGREQPVAVALGISTDVDQRGRGILGRLQRFNEEEAMARGSVVALTFANAMSRPIFIERLGFQKFWSGRVWARPPLPAFARGRLGIEELGSIPAGTERLLGSANGQIADAAFLDWRYLRSPRAYRVLGAYEGEELRGLLALRLRRGRLAVVCHALGEVAQLLRAAGSNSALATIALVPREQRRAFLAAGFVPTHKTVSVLGKVLQRGGSLGGCWQFQLGDFDVF
jgi:predicted N-acetyltransferase YhbS